MSIGGLLLAGRGLDQHSLKLYNIQIIKRWRYVVDNDGDYCPDKFEV